MAVVDFPGADASVALTSAREHHVTQEYFTEGNTLDN